MMVAISSRELTGRIGGLLAFYHSDPLTLALTELQLEFPFPFDGNGSAIPYDPTQQYKSLLGINRRIVEVSSATSFLVPTPSSVVLTGISGVAGLGRVGLRRRKSIVA